MRKYNSFYTDYAKIILYKNTVCKYVKNEAFAVRMEKRLLDKSQKIWYLIIMYL